MSRNVQELEDEIAARDAAERVSAGSTANLDEVILRLRDAVSNLETAREQGRV